MVVGVIESSFVTDTTNGRSGRSASWFHFSQCLVVLLSLVALALGSLEPAGYTLPRERLPPPPPTDYLPPEEEEVVEEEEGSTFGPSSVYLGPSSSPPLRQYLLPEVAAPAVAAGPAGPVGPAAEYLGFGANPAVSSLPLQSYVPASSLLAPHNSGPRAQQGRRLTDAYLAPVGKSSPPPPPPPPHGYSTPRPLGKPARTPASRYLRPAASADNFSGYRYGARDNVLGNTAKPAKYGFQYRVNDNHGNDYGHQESRDGDTTWGMFSVLLPDGRRQIVHYDADANGYRPRITYEDSQLATVNQYPNGGAPY